MKGNETLCIERATRKVMVISKDGLELMDRCLCEKHFDVIKTEIEQEDYPVPFTAPLPEMLYIQCDFGKEDKK